ncbi:MAG: aminopeptidase P family protein [Clostridia bacterium]|nr:aminopeptidase P family protein [Clostridia bacterium]
MLPRIEKLKKKLKELGLDSFLVMSPVNRRYLSGFTGTSGFLLITRKQNFLLTDFRYIEQATKQAPSFQIVKHDYPWLKTLEQLLKRLPVENMGLESDYVAYKQYRELEKQLSFIELYPQDGIIEGLRLVKDAEEIANIKNAAQIADKAFDHILGIIKPGIKEREIALELEFFMRSQGADGVSFDTIVASGKRSALPHGVASEKIIEKGDLVTLDYGCIYNGYCSDMTRTVVIGQPSDKQRKIYNIVLEAQIMGLEAVKAGLSAREIDDRVRSFISEKGYGENFGHGLGHGVGLCIHENPSLSPRDNTEVLANMVVTIEPGIYIPDWGGVRIEDLVLVTDTGYNNFTCAKKELIVI